MGKQSVGKAGEDAAAVFLRKKGYRILARNIRSRRGEIDIVARYRDTICFVEVRTRQNLVSHALALESVGAQKRGRLIRLASAYLQDRGWSDRRARFDVVSVLLREEGTRIILVQDAFSLADVPGER